MIACHDNQAALRRPPPREAVEIAEASGPRPEVVLAVLALALVLMAAPVLVALISIVDADLLAGARSWAHGASTWLSYLAHIQLLSLPLAAVVARASEDA